MSSLSNQSLETQLALLENEVANMKLTRSEDKDLLRLSLQTFVTKQEFEPVKDSFVTKEAFGPVQKLVYGMTGIVLVGVLTAVIALVVPKFTSSGQLSEQHK